MSDELVQTHSAGCHAFGHRHYQCALAEIERLRAEVATIRNLRTVAESALAALRKRVDEVRPLFNRYDKRLESPAAGFTGAIAVRVEDYDALRRLVETEG